MRRKMKQPKTQFKVTVSWFKMKKVFSKMGLYPKTFPKSKFEFALWCMEYMWRVKGGSKDDLTKKRAGN